MESTTSSPANAYAFFKSIDIETLFAVRRLTAWVLERERAKRSGETPPPASTALKQQLQCLPAARLFRGIQRHRLEKVLQADPAVSELLPDLQVDLQRAARSETMSALALASLSREMAGLFAEAGIPLLVIKGVPLALQTTGSPTARGRGDCDLFVDPSQVGAAIGLLQSAGFALSQSTSCVGDDSIWGSYSRFVWIEVALQRHACGRNQFIDLHWHATHVRGVLLDFQALWDRGEVLYITDQPIRTLSRRDALVHACCHAAADRWMALRNLVDIERLARGLSKAERVELKRLRPVRKSWVALADAFEERGESCLKGRALALRVKAQLAQQRPWRSLGDGEWTKANRLGFFAHYVSLSFHPVHILSIVFQQLIRPVDLIDLKTGKSRSLWQVIALRMGKLRRRLRASNELFDRRA